MYAKCFSQILAIKIAVWLVRFVDIISHRWVDLWLMPRCFGRDCHWRFDITNSCRHQQSTRQSSFLLWLEFGTHPKILHSVRVGKCDGVNKVDRVIHSEMGISKVAHCIVCMPKIWYNDRPWKYVILNDWEQSVSVPPIYWHHEFFFCCVNSTKYPLLFICPWLHFRRLKTLSSNSTVRSTPPICTGWLTSWSAYTSHRNIFPSMKVCWLTPNSLFNFLNESSSYNHAYINSMIIANGKWELLKKVQLCATLVYHIARSFHLLLIVITCLTCLLVFVTSLYLQHQSIVNAESSTLISQCNCLRLTFIIG